MSENESPREMKRALGEVKAVVSDTKEGLLDTMSEGREVVATVRVKPVRRLVRRRVAGLLGANE